MANKKIVPGAVAKVARVDGIHRGLRWEPNIHERIRINGVALQNIKLPAKEGDYLRILPCPPSPAQRNPYREKTGDGEYRLWWYVQALNRNRRSLTGPNSRGWLIEREVKRNANGNLITHEYLELFGQTADCPQGFADALEPGVTALVTPGLDSRGEPDHLMLRAGPSRGCAAIHEGAGLEKGDEVSLSGRCAITKGGNQHRDWEYIWRLVRVESGKNDGKTGWVCQEYRYKRKGDRRFNFDFYLTAA